MSNNTKIVERGRDPRESALDSLFSDYSSDGLTVLDLPSKGRFYEGFQGIEINPLTYLDEQKILGSKDANVDIVSKLLEKATAGVEVGSLLSMDKTYLLMKVREASYGDTYEFKVTCPECSTDVTTELILSKHLNMVEIPDDLEDPRTITLPKLKAKVEVRFPRSREEVLLKDTEAIYQNAYKFVVSIEGNKDPIFISKAIKRLGIKDTKKLISEIVQSEYGVDPRFIFECPECKHSETMAIPLDINFFSVS
mgnify:FL=1|tara:strand:- start:124 stop:879 length:756 start_codon:yes stop_codon:yes gene_type:complete